MMERALERLKGLPWRAEETWQGGLVRMPTWITGEGPVPYRPYLPLWVAVRDEKLHAGEPLRPEGANLDVVVETLLAFAFQDEFGGYRPGRVEVMDDALAEHLKGVLAEADIEVRLVERLEAVERALDSMREFQNDNEPSLPSPLDGKDVTLERMRHFAAAASAFYRTALWQNLTDVDLVRIDRPRCPRGMEYAVVLGASRIVYGLALYQSVDHYVQFSRVTDEQNAPSTNADGVWQLSFNPITQIPHKDADLWEDHDLSVAGEQAYPIVAKFNPNGQVTRPAAAELTFLEGLLWTFAETTEEGIDSGRWQKLVTTHDGPTQMALAIPDLLEPPSLQEWMRRGFVPDRRANERTFSDIDRFFREHPPANEEEMKAVLERQFSGQRIDQLVTQPDTPAERAQELCHRAFDTFGRRRVQLAREALQLDLDCAEACVILAEQAGTLDAEADYYAKGIAAGERALGPEVFEKEAGRFWGVSATRPYMRARLGLAQSLEQLDRVDEAVEHYRELLRLNPEDNQGARYLLMPRLLELGHDVEAARLLKSSDEESASWAYAQALLAFRLSGKSTAARRELRSAFRVNPHVPELLAHDGPLPRLEHYSPGSPEEAVFCAEELRRAFQRTDGARGWLSTEHKRHQKEADARLREQRGKERQKRKKRKRR